MSATVAALTDGPVHCRGRCLRGVGVAVEKERRVKKERERIVGGCIAAAKVSL